MKRKILFLAMTVAIGAPIAGVSLSRLRAAPKPFSYCFKPCQSDDDCSPTGYNCPACTGYPTGSLCRDVE
jgi:hypothetical protein